MHKTSKHLKEIDEKVNMTFRIFDAKNNDTLTIFYWPKKLGIEASYDRRHAAIFQATKSKNGEFHIEIQRVDGLGYFSAGLRTNKGFHNLPVFFLENYYINKGDRLSVNITKGSNPKFVSNYMDLYLSYPDYRNYRISFSGVGSRKNELKYQIDKALVNYGLSEPPNFRSTGLVKASIAGSMIENAQRFLQPIEYETLKLDYISFFTYCFIFPPGASTFYPILYPFYKNLPQLGVEKPLAKQDIEAIQRQQKIFLANLDLDSLYNVQRTYANIIGFDKLKWLTNKAKDISIWYYKALQAEAISKAKSSLNQANSIDMVDLIDKNLTGIERDKAMTAYVIERGKDSLLENRIRNNQLLKIDSKYYASIINDYLNHIREGAPAYKFSLPSYDGTNVKMTDLKGKVVFIDYWFVGCTGCSIFYQKKLKYVEEKYKSNPNVVFVTITPETDVPTWKENVDNEKYTSKHIINLYTASLGYKHDILKYYNIGSFPHPMIVDRNGNLFRQNISDWGDRPIEYFVNLIDQALKK